MQPNAIYMCMAGHKCSIDGARERPSQGKGLCLVHLQPGVLQTFCGTGPSLRQVPMVPCQSQENVAEAMR